MRAWKASLFLWWEVQSNDQNPESRYGTASEKHGFSSYADWNAGAFHTLYGHAGDRDGLYRVPACYMLRAVSAERHILTGRWKNEENSLREFLSPQEG